MTIATFLCLLFAPTGMAQDLPEEEEELDVPTETEEINGSNQTEGFHVEGSQYKFDEEDEDGVMADFVAAKMLEPPAPVNFHLQPGKSVFANSYPVQVVSFNEDTLVAEQPLFLGKRSEFAAAYPAGALVQATFKSGEDEVVVRQRIEPDQVLLTHPTFAFLKTSLPFTKSAVDVRVRLAVAPLPAEGEEQAALKEKFAQTTVFTRPR